jgi:ABC-2 type transport system ATP-binding protein
MWVFLRELNKRGTTIILTTHYLEEAESLCRNIAIINHGTIVENSSMERLLHQLHKEIFVLNLKDDLEQLPEIPGYQVEQLDRNTLEVEVNRDQGINRLFETLSRYGIEVSSMRNKQNRLEQLFIGMLEGHRAGGSK